MRESTRRTLLVFRKQRPHIAPCSAWPPSHPTPRLTSGGCSVRYLLRVLALKDSSSTDTNSTPLPGSQAPAGPAAAAAIAASSSSSLPLLALLSMLSRLKEAAMPSPISKSSACCPPSLLLLLLLLLLLAPPPPRSPAAPPAAAAVAAASSAGTSSAASTTALGGSWMCASKYARICRPR